MKYRLVGKTDNERIFKKATMFDKIFLSNLCFDLTSLLYIFQGCEFTISLDKEDLVITVEEELR